MAAMLATEPQTANATEKAKRNSVDMESLPSNRAWPPAQSRWYRHAALSQRNHAECRLATSVGFAILQTPHTGHSEHRAQLRIPAAFKRHVYGVIAGATAAFNGCKSLRMVCRRRAACG